jgi:hypothetical protein
MNFDFLNINYQTRFFKTASFQFNNELLNEEENYSRDSSDNLLKNYDNSPQIKKTENNIEYNDTRKSYGSF